MNFRAFRAKYLRYPIIKSCYFALEENPPYIRRLVSEWCRKGWLIEVKRGMYLINEPELLIGKENFLLANELYEPSYVSLESALSFYGMIPEAVLQTTSVTTRKTMLITNGMGSFRYRHVRHNLFWGFDRQRIGGAHVLLAHPEKALLDLLYLRQGSFSNGTEVLESLRMQHIEKLSPKVLLQTAVRFDVPRLYEIVKELMPLLPTKKGSRR